MTSPSQNGCNVLKKLERRDRKWLRNINCRKKSRHRHQWLSLKLRQLTTRRHSDLRYRATRWKNRTPYLCLRSDETSLRWSAAAATTTQRGAECCIFRIAFFTFSLFRFNKTNVVLNRSIRIFVIRHVHQISTPFSYISSSSSYHSSHHRYFQHYYYYSSLSTYIN